MHRSIWAFVLLLDPAVALVAARAAVGRRPRFSNIQPQNAFRG